MTAKNWTLPVAFYFQVKVCGEEYAFSEVSGLDSEMETESLREGGSNNMEYKLPKQVKNSNLVLKRALLPLECGLVFWVRSVLEGSLILPVIPLHIVVSLLDSNGKPLYTWSCAHAYPVKWSVEPLGADKNNILVESIEFAYTTLTRS